MFSAEFFKIFKNTFLYRTPSAAASENSETENPAKYWENATQIDKPEAATGAVLYKKKRVLKNFTKFKIKYLCHS